MRIPNGNPRTNAQREIATRAPARPLLLCCYLLQAFCFCTSAQSYSIGWSSIDGGGGASASSLRSINGTIGQPDAATMSGRKHALSGGFWSFITRTEAPSYAELLGQSIFYNLSIFDSNDGGAAASDDNAIAPNKTALLPGRTATFANYTSYSKGINGIMVDIARLPGTPTAEDFNFKVGNNNSPSEWPAVATPPSSISFRPGDGIAGADRVTIIWPDNAIQKTWLQVTVRATPNTGLPEDAVFYFGNAIAECGNDPANAIVNVTDVVLTRANPRSPLNRAGIEFPYDHDRDGLVNVRDIAIARANQTSPVTALRLITPAVTTPQSAPSTFTGAVPLSVAASPASTPGDPVMQPEDATFQETVEPSSLLWRLAGEDRLQLEYPATDSRTYTLEASTDLRTGIWVESAVRPALKGSRWLWDMPLPRSGNAFYRITPAAQNSKLH
jgi:hypothetical protein